MNQPIYGIVYNCKKYLVLGSNNDWIIIKFLDDGTDNVGYECNNQTIPNDNVMNMYLVIIKWNHGAIDADYSTYHGQYIIKLYSYPYTPRTYFNVDGQCRPF